LTGKFRSTLAAVGIGGPPSPPHHRALPVCLLVSLCFSGILYSQQKIPQQVYQPNIANEDWTFLANPAMRSDFWDPVKYIRLGHKDWSVGFSGEIRIRPEGFHIHKTKDTPGIIDNYMFQRYLFGADFRFGKRFRVFTEMQSGLVSGKFNSPRPSDKNLLSIHQAFVEYRAAEKKDRSFLLRLGRQELRIGSSRLIAAAQGLNVKRSFDGLSFAWGIKNWMTQVGIARLVKLNPGVLDDPPDSGQDFWGLALSHRKFPFQTSLVGGYYLGIDRKLSEYVQGLGPERRHTAGVRVKGGWKRLDFSYDLLLQWGRFQTLPIRAWAIATDTGLRVGKGRWQSRLGLSVNTSSGDRDPTDHSLESFNPLFPGNAYSGLVGLFGPTNMTDFTPSFRIPIRTNLWLGVETPFYFRRSTGDGIYSIDLHLLLDGQHTMKKYVGTNPGVVMIWQATRHINVTGAISRFLSGGFLNGTFVENGFGFYSAAFTYRF